MTFDDAASDEAAAASRPSRTLTSIIALFVGAGMCWLLAFSSGLGGRPPLIVVGAPAQAVSGDRLPLRIIAIDEGAKTQVKGPFTASVIDGLRTASSGTLERVPTDIALPEVEGPVTLRIEGPATASPPAQIDATIRLRRSLPPRGSFTFRPWRESVGKAGGPPLYPLDGDVLATRRSRLVVLPPEGPMLEEVQGNPAETKDVRGRPLRLERKDIRLRAPLTVAPGARVTVEVEPAEPMELDLIVDGWARRSTVVSGRATLDIPADVGEDAPFVVHVSRRPFPQGVGVFHVGRVSKDAAGTGSWLVRQVREAGGAEDPLVQHLARGTFPRELEAQAALALSRRLVPAQLRAPRIGASSEAQRAQLDRARHASVDRWRTPFRVLSLFFALAALIAVLRGAGGAVLDDGEEPIALKEQKRTRLWGALGLAMALSLLFLLDWTLG